MNALRTLFVSRQNEYSRPIAGLKRCLQRCGTNHFQQAHFCGECYSFTRTFIIPAYERLPVMSRLRYWSAGGGEGCDS